jgi:hypothetical protein
MVKIPKVKADVRFTNEKIIDRLGGHYDPPIHTRCASLSALAKAIRRKMEAYAIVFKEI